MKIGRLLLWSLCALAFIGWASAQILDLEKDTNGFDADTQPGPSINCDDSVTWTYVVTIPTTCWDLLLVRSTAWIPVSR